MATIDDVRRIASSLPEAAGEPHDNGFPAVLVRLAAVDVDELRELLTDARRAMAPAELRSQLPES